MVDFTLTEEQQSLRHMAHEFATQEIRPVAWEYDRDGTWPEAIIEKAWEVGLMNPHIPEQYGGAGASAMDGVLIEEELGWGCSGIGTSISCNGLASAPVLLGGSEEIKRTYLGMLTEAPKLASFCLTEPDAGSDVSGMRTRAVKRGDKYVINGSKTFITNGGYADWYTVYAKTDPDAGHRGISAFVVPRDAGVVVDKHEDKMGQRASNTAAITFNDVEIPAANLLGEENHGFKLAMMTLDRTRPGVAAMAIGIARAAFEFAIEYSKERVQFGVPIAMHQAIQFMIADMATKVHIGRLATWNSAVLLDQGRRNTLESSHAKRFAADTAMEVTTDAVQVYGGYGFIKDYPVEKLMRDAKIMQLYEGTSQIQRLVHRDMLRRGVHARRHRGGYSSGMDGVATDVMDTEIESDRLRQASDPELRGAIAEEMAVSPQAGGRGDVDDRTGRRGLQRVERGVDPVERAGEVDRDDRVPLLGGAAADRPDGRDSGVVDQHVESAVALNGPRDGFGPLVAVGDVEVDIASGISELRSDRLSFLIEEVADHDLGAVGRHRAGVTFAHAPRATGDQRDLTCESITNGVTHDHGK
jgi:acyl-CoA dehydrogenase